MVVVIFKVHIYSGIRYDIIAINHTVSQEAFQVFRNFRNDCISVHKSRGTDKEN